MFLSGGGMFPPRSSSQLALGVSQVFLLGGCVPQGLPARSKCQLLFTCLVFHLGLHPFGFSQRTISNGDGVCMACWFALLAFCLVPILSSFAARPMRVYYRYRSGVCFFSINPIERKQHNPILTLHQSLTAPHFPPTHMLIRRLFARHTYGAFPLLILLMWCTEQDQAAQQFFVVFATHASVRPPALCPLSLVPLHAGGSTVVGGTRHVYNSVCLNPTLRRPILHHLWV